MELRSREELPQQKRQAQGTLNFRSTKKRLQLQQKSIPNDSKMRQLPTETKQSAQETWPPVHNNKLKTNTLKKELPKKLLLLEELYHSMEASISLLRIRRQICTFSTIAAAIESSTHRRFLRSHLAQIKYILPDALQVEEYVSWDAESQCSRRDLRVSLHPISKEGSASMQRCRSPQKSTEMVIRRREFRRRLLDFFRKNKEIDVDVPQASMFEGVAAACNDECVKELPEQSSAHVEDLKEVDEGDTLSHEKEKVLQSNCDETLDADECDHTPLPIGFNLNQLKKYPRSPSEIRHHQQVPPAPFHGTMSHLPPLFKPHFSAKRQPGVVEGDSGKAIENAGIFSDSVEITQRFSIIKCKHTASDKARLGSAEDAAPIEEVTPLAVSDASLSPMNTPAIVSSSLTKKSTGNVRKVLQFTSPIGKNRGGPEFSLHEDEMLQTPKRVKRTCAHDKARTEQIAPLAVSDAFLSPSKSPAEDLPSFMKKSIGNVSGVLPFNSPSIRPEYPSLEDGMHTPNCGRLTIAHGTARLDSTELATPLAVSDAFRSPIQTPASQLPSLMKKSTGKTTRVLGNVSRVLPFNSPIGKKIEGPGNLCLEDRSHSSSCEKLTELQPVSIFKDLTLAKNSENALLADGSCAANFVELTTLDGADKLSASDVEILKCLPQELLNDLQAKERKQLEDIQSGIDKKRRRQQMIAGLPKLFNNVRLVFQSGNRTVLTRKDLTKMVLSSHPDITDQGEVMEQLQLLVELAPAWISVNLSSTGDSLYRINKNADMRAVSKALVEAK
ncbi:hypothetical protein GOP47_0017769 [Adiantum capillus-veneris]|uniref:CDT1 Geminin-binding domain-containing protein n=1 Tax=Adiantum capillus-veneris TaxID=13818 RepID=A0A9D4ZC40_ADICA|nr:hypothetical protein GOP47_0017769 [Adiantum capillus-veneris]